jgi:hypothetical protein
MSRLFFLIPAALTVVVMSVPILSLASRIVA